ncbi:alpha/beta hydrolase [Clostridium sp. MSJ-11]|uniref:Alpha/beta hydrolase n=1 Tax=Clostridium mobile TaxID=2841512 RepID=A0ABS6EET8_9CLOT|nr:alpha/beta hydrolase [Clostridium mobile]MBU5483735.1 alpha/beta hydrolase [Clostridium mobile]
MKIYKKIILILVGCLLIGFIIEIICGRLDKNKYIAPGKLVEINDNKMHIFGTGSGDNTIVLIPGYGTSSPYVDFQPLWSRLSENNRVVVVERFGYGFSDISKSKRSMENIIKEMNEALKISGENPPYTLVGHSLGGTISIAYSQAYPNEVANIVMLDAPVPKVYKDWQRPFQPLESIIPFLKSTGLIRGITLNNKIMALLRGEQNEYKEVSKEFWDIDRSLFIRNAMNSNVKNEMKLLNESIKFVDDKPYTYEIPILFITTPNMYEMIPSVKGIQDEYIKKAKKAKLIELNGRHYIHQYYPNEISEAIIDFINVDNK